MALPKNAKEELNAFKAACEKFIDSKLILIEKSISDILKTIAKGGMIYNCLAEEIVGYNFPAEFETATRSGSFDLVMSDKKVVPFVFNLLNEMDNGNIDIFTFIKKMFGEDTQVAYASFGDILIRNFMNGINELLENKFEENVEEVEEGEVEKTLASLDEAFLSRIKFVVENIMGGIIDKKNAKLKSRSDINTICVSILLCIDNAEYIGLLGQMIGLKYLIAKTRYFKNDVKELELIIKAFNEL